MELIIVKNVYKEFKIGFKKNQSALERFLSLFSGREPKKKMKVLKNISLTVNAGEIVAVCGPNGSGKSTLLRLIAGIYEADSGMVQTNGRVIPLFGFGNLLKERLTLKDNIYLLGLLYGLDQKIIDKRFNAIIELAQLDKFINTKIYQFSDGMKLRLIFSIAVHCDPDILLLDEVFAVGDENFKQRSITIIKELLKKGTAVLLTTHYLEIIENQLGRHCDKIISIHNGELRKMDCSI